MRSAVRIRDPRSGEIIPSVLVVLLALLAVAIVMAPGLNADLPGRDAGVFLYIGNQILEGEIPYRDIWDHKGPLIYYVNAVGVALSPGRETGIWLLEATALLASGMGLYWLLKRVFGGLAAAVAVAIFFAGLGYTLSPGNYTEEFSLPLQVAALWLFVKAESTPDGKGLWFLIGTTGAAAFLLRPNNAGIQLSIVIYLILERVVQGQGLARLGWLALGVSAVLVPVGAFFTSNRALKEMLDAVLRYNSVYIQSSLKVRIDATLEGLRLLSPTGITLVAVSAWIISLRSWSDDSERARLVRLAVIALPVELLLIAVAGRSLDHYYIAWLPILTVLAAHLLSLILDRAANLERNGNRRLSPQVMWAIGLTIAALLLPTRRLVPPFIELIRSGPRQPTKLAPELIEFDSEFLLMWGAETAYNFVSGKPSPTRFAYQYPLYTCGYVTIEMVEEFQLDIMQRLPLIVDSSSTNPSVPPIDSERRAEWSEETANCALTVPMLELLDFIDSNYEAIGRTTYAGWPIFIPTD